MMEFQYLVGVWTGQRQERLQVYARFSNAQDAVRAARRLDDKRNKAWIYGHGPLPDTISVVRRGGGSVFDLDWRWCRSITTRRWFLTLREHIRQVETPFYA
ncbi:MAG: hypothetical protein ACREGR_01220 [Minisyncoccia bacterium]